MDDADYVWYNNEPLRISLESGEDPAGARIERAFKKAADDFVPLMRGGEQHRGPTADEIHIAAFLEKNGIEKIRPFSGFTARAFFRVFPKVN